VGIEDARETAKRIQEKITQRGDQEHRPRRGSTMEPNRHRRFHQRCNRPVAC
jgi:hypothetical protein